MPQALQRQESGLQGADQVALLRLSYGEDGAPRPALYASAARWLGYDQYSRVDQMDEEFALARDGVDEIKEVAPDCIYSTPAANAAGGTNAVIFKDHQQ